MVYFCIHNSLISCACISEDLPFPPLGVLYPCCVVLAPASALSHCRFCLYFAFWCCFSCVGTWYFFASSFLITIVRVMFVVWRSFVAVVLCLRFTLMSLLFRCSVLPTVVVSYCYLYWCSCGCTMQCSSCSFLFFDENGDDYC